MRCWHPGPMQAIKSKGGELVMLSMPPYKKISTKSEYLTRKTTLPKMVFLSSIATHWGQDELVFDGRSITRQLKRWGLLVADAFKESSLINISRKQNRVLSHLPLLHNNEQSTLRHVYSHWFARNQGCKQKQLSWVTLVLVALTGPYLAIAYDALGKNKTSLAMPSRYTSDMSNNDNRNGNYSGVKLEKIEIEPLFQSYLDVFENSLSLRARNSKGKHSSSYTWKLTYGIIQYVRKDYINHRNKSELSVGYCTLYEDMAGGCCTQR